MIDKEKLREWKALAEDGMGGPLHLKLATATLALIEALVEERAQVLRSEMLAAACAARKGQVVQGPEGRVVFVFPGMEQKELGSFLSQIETMSAKQARRELMED